MIEMHGSMADAIVFTNTVDAESAHQIYALLEQPMVYGQKVRFMPDVHAGAGCVIGTTMTIKDSVIPSLVGVDISCGVETVRLKEKEINYDKLDEIIRKTVPSGMEVRETPLPQSRLIDYSDLRCNGHVNSERAMRSIGTLGGGNHFIEIDRDADDDDLYLTVHSGSRHLGVEVASYYQNEAYRRILDNRKEIDATIKSLKEQGREKEIGNAIKEIKKRTPNVPKSFAYCEGDLFDDYIHDMKIIQRFAMHNRQAIAQQIIRGYGLTPVDSLTTVHNYIDTDSMILRKGSVSAKSGEDLVIPLNMRDGVLMCVGKGNPNWNYSAPHGAGRIMSRAMAKRKFSIEEFSKSMTGIYTTSVCDGTIDECAMAYKNMNDIIDNIGDTVDILGRMIPTYNFKAST